MGRAGHRAVRAERPKRIDDPLIVSGDNHVAHTTALARLLDHVLNQRFAGPSGENFGGKTGGSEAGGNDDRRSQSRTSQTLPRSASADRESPTSNRRATIQVTGPPVKLRKSCRQDAPLQHGEPSSL